MTPQTMAVITRIFPPDRAGRPWGSGAPTAGVATLVGPILGGVLVDGARLGVDLLHQRPGRRRRLRAGLAAGALAAHPRHRFDLPGVVLSAVGLFLLVFGIQEGETYDWGTITGPISVWGLIIAGHRRARGCSWSGRRSTSGEPLLPLSLFRDRNFSLANVAITTVGLHHHGDGLAAHALRPDRARPEPRPSRR